MVPTTVIVRYSFKRQYMAGAGAEIRDKGGAGAKINNFGSATLV